MEFVLLLGRIIVGVYFLYNAANHFNAFGGTAGLIGWMDSKGVPAANMLVFVAGALLAIGGVSILTGFQPTLGALALVVFFVPVTYKMHDFWNETDPTVKMNQQLQFTKNLALLGFSLMIMSIPQPWPLSIGG